MPKPDLYIYLSKFRTTFAKHKRKGEEVMNKKSQGYLDKINSGYLEYIKSQTELNVLIIDVSDRDFVKNQEDYLFLFWTIQNKINQL
jgi:deoxyadenosine/deoxycytidine kinase